MRKSAIIELEDKWQGNVIIYLKGLTRKKSLKKKWKLCDRYTFWESRCKKLSMFYMVFLSAKPNLPCISIL